MAVFAIFHLFLLTLKKISYKLTCQNNLWVDWKGVVTKKYSRRWSLLEISGFVSPGRYCQRPFSDAFSFSHWPLLRHQSTIHSQFQTVRVCSACWHCYLLIYHDSRFLKLDNLEYLYMLQLNWICNKNPFVGKSNFAQFLYWSN